MGEDSFLTAVKKGVLYFRYMLQHLDPAEESISGGLKVADIQDFVKETEEYKIVCERAVFRPTVYLYSHHDADGLSSAGILAHALIRANIPFHIRIIRQLEHEFIEEITELEENSVPLFFIFSDFGSGQFEQLEKRLSSPFLVLDHHMPPEEIAEEPPPPYHINPHFHRIDGASEISASGVSYLFAKELNPNNIDLSLFALVGATGDIQTAGEQGKFIGLNETILTDALENNEVKQIKDLNIDRTRPLSAALAYTLRAGVTIPRLTNNPRNCRNFIKSQGINVFDELKKEQSLEDLSTSARKKLVSGLIKYLLVDCQFSADILKEIVIMHYLIENELYNDKISDLSLFSSVLNACGRHGHADTAISLILGDNDAIAEGYNRLKEHKQLLRQGVKYAQEHWKEYPHSFVFYGADAIKETVVGSVATILSFDEELALSKPIVGYADSDRGFFKVSCRTHKKCVDSGVHLARAIQKTHRELKITTMGGGHAPAAGTRIPQKQIKEFLSVLDRILGEQTF